MKKLQRRLTGEWMYVFVHECMTAPLLHRKLHEIYVFEHSIEVFAAAAVAAGFLAF